MTTGQWAFLWTQEYRIFKFLCLKNFLQIGAMSSNEADHTQAQLRSIWHSMEACGCCRQIQRLSLLAGITANLGRKRFAWGREWFLRGVCRPPGCLSRVELQVCIRDFCLYLSVYSYEGAQHDAGTVFEDIACRGSYDFFPGV